MRASAGRAARPAATGEGMSPIIEHPDVRRMLLTMQALTAAARAICYSLAEAHRPRASAPDDGRARARRHERAALLTPIAKAFSTDIGVEVASLGVQVHGGMGFIEETGAAQHLRDARIAPIYEGTNGIQAIDLVTRKLPLSARAGGRARIIAELRATPRRSSAPTNRRASATWRARLRDAVDALDTRDRCMLARRCEPAPSDALAGATPYLRLFALAQGGGVASPRRRSRPRAMRQAIAIRPMPARIARRASSPSSSPPAPAGLRGIAVVEGAGLVCPPTPRLSARRARPPCRLAGKTLFITGASRGIGLAIALTRGARRRQHRHRRQDRPSRTRSSKARSTPPPRRSRRPAARRCRSSSTCATRRRSRTPSPRRREAFGGIDIVVNNASRHPA